ncbi:hypothetical protein AB0N09_35435 [Streptomyces erythrochromogenes]|uniref:hypothetical protein n=1 Tax=Streptomyces erythrochromogenes TaxID=285574 RepID=UPI003439BE10
MRAERAVLRTAATLAMATALALGTAMSAHAARHSVHHGSDYATYDTSNGWFEVCDMEQDGNGVYVYFSKTYGSRDTGQYGDANGSQGGCGNGYITGYKYMNICEDTVGWDECVSVTIKP